jgi:hypothetical protein
MPSKSVATASDVSASPASGYSAGPIVAVPYMQLKTDGQQVIYQAACTFTQTSSPFATDVVTLNASTTVLQKNESNVLRDGDSITSALGNQLSVSASHPLKSG